MPCNCRRDELALVQTDPGFNEFIYLVLIVVSFGAIMALLFFLCEILSKSQKKNLEKKRTQTQKPPPKKVGYPELEHPVAVPVPIHTVSGMVDKEKPLHTSNPQGSLFGILPPPPPAGKTHSTLAQASIPVHTRTIPAYPLSPGFVSHSRMPSLNYMTPSRSSSAPPRPSPALSDADVVQKLVVSSGKITPPKPVRTLSYKPPSIEIDPPHVDHGKVSEKRVTIPPKSDKFRFGHSATLPQEVEQPLAQLAPPAAVEVQYSAPPSPVLQKAEKPPSIVKTLTDKLQTSASLVVNGGSAMSKGSNENAKNTRTTTTTTEFQEIIRNGSTVVNSGGSDSKTLAHSIMMRLFRGQQESDLLFRQIQNLEKKMELMIIEFGKRDKEVTPEKVTQGVQTNEVLPERSVFAKALAAYEATERDTSMESITVESRVAADASMLERRTESPIRSVEFKPKVRTTTQVISLEAVPVISGNSRRSTPIPPLVHSVKMPGMDSGEDSDLSMKSDSPDFNRIPVFEMQQNASSFNKAEASIKEMKLNLQNSIENNKFTQLSAYSAGKMSDEVSEEELRLKYEKQLKETMTQLRADCQQRLNENHDEQRFLYLQRESGLQKEVGSLSSSIENQGSVLANLQWKLSKFEKNITTLADEKLLLENCAREVKSGWEADKRMFNEDKERLEGLLMKMRSERQELLKGYQHLVEVKGSLDSELVKYKALVEEEEQRFTSDRRPPSPPSLATHPGTMSPDQTASEWTLADGRPLSPPPSVDSSHGIMSQSIQQRTLTSRRPLSPIPPESFGVMLPGQTTSERTFTFFATEGRRSRTENASNGNYL